MAVVFIEKDQNWQNEQTVYWFDVDGETYGVSEQPLDVAVVDCDGCPVNLGDAKNAHLRNLPGLVTDELRSDF
jgi:hypothetical protein